MVLGGSSLSLESQLPIPGFWTLTPACLTASRTALNPSLLVTGPHCCPPSAGLVRPSRSPTASDLKPGAFPPRMPVHAHTSLTSQNAQAFAWPPSALKPYVPQSATPRLLLAGSCCLPPGPRVAVAVAVARDEQGLLSVCIISLIPFPPETKLLTGLNMPGPCGSAPSRADP